MKWVKFTFLWLIAVAILWALFWFGVSDFFQPIVFLGEPDIPEHRPIARLAFSWLMMIIVFLTAIFLSKKTLED